MGTTGRLLQVNVSRGGIPKLPVERAWIRRPGVDGDAHRERTVHGGPHRAVCLFGIEAIERLRSEGHPVEPGSVGENLTTSGVEWSTLPIGSRVRIGQTVLLELASPTMPCATQKPNFTDGRFSRISITHHPTDSRMYARVLAEGEVRPGDEIHVEPPPADSRAGDEQVLGRLDRAAAKADLTTWRAAREAGHDVRIVDDGELVIAAAPGLPGPAFNCAFGLARLPGLLPDATAFYATSRVDGWLVTESAPWPDSTPDGVLAVHAGPPSGVPRDPGEAGDTDGALTIRRLGPADLPLWEEVRRRSGGSGIYSRRRRSAWNGIRACLLEVPRVHVLLAELDGRPVASAVVTVAGGVGWLRGGVVVPAARGRGIQRALISARAAVAAEEGCELLGSWAEQGSVSSRNLARMGLRQVGVREQHRYRPPRARWMSGR